MLCISFVLLEMMCRYLYRPYGRVDRTRLKSKLLNRCVEHGMFCFLDQYVAMNMLLELVQTIPTSEGFKIAMYIVQHWWFLTWL